MQKKTKTKKDTDEYSGQCVWPKQQDGCAKLWNLMSMKLCLCEVNESQVSSSLKCIVISKLFGKILPLNTLAVRALVKTQHLRHDLVLWWHAAWPWRSAKNVSVLHSVNLKQTPAPLFGGERDKLSNGHMENVKGQKMEARTGYLRTPGTLRSSRGDLSLLDDFSGNHTEERSTKPVTPPPFFSFWELLLTCHSLLLQAFSPPKWSFISVLTENSELIISNLE
jgi:hypothetical protein